MFKGTRTDGCAPSCLTTVIYLERDLMWGVSRISSILTEMLSLFFPHNHNSIYIKFHFYSFLWNWYSLKILYLLPDKALIQRIQIYLIVPILSKGAIHTFLIRPSKKSKHRSRYAGSWSVGPYVCLQPTPSHCWNIDINSNWVTQY